MHKTLLVAITSGSAIVFIMTIIWLFASPKTWEDYWERGGRHLGAKNYRAAIADFSKSLKLTPQHDHDNRSAAHAARGIAYLQLDELAQALADFSAAIKLRSKGANQVDSQGIADLFMLRATTYSRLGDHVRAAEDWRERSIILDNDLQSVCNQGFELSMAGDYDAARHCFEQAIQQNPTDPLPVYGRGYTSFQEGCYDAAIQDFTRAIAIRPNYANAYFNRGYSHFKIGEISEAAEDRMRAIAIDQSYAEEEYE